MFSEIEFFGLISLLILVLLVRVVLKVDSSVMVIVFSWKLFCIVYMICFFFFD